MINPYIFYVISFSVALLAYQLGWSDMFPSLSSGLLIFLIITILLHTGFALWFRKKRFIGFTNVSDLDERRAIGITIFIYFLWLLEFLYEGGVPLLKILFKMPYDYRLFGIPSLHVFVVTFSSFFTIYLFHHYLSARRSVFLILCLLNMMAAILIYSRAMLIFNLAGCGFLYLLKIKHLSGRAIFLPVILLLFLVYFFGVLGTLRVSREARSSYDNDNFMNTGKAGSGFRNSFVPAEFFWGYMYVTSPIANLQQNIAQNKGTEVSSGSFVHMVNNEIMMDFISKRINRLLGVERKGEFTIGGPFNVSTVYSRPFSYLGWPGMIISALIILFLPVVYLKILPAQSPYFLTGFAILSTMFLFLAYDNTIRFTGLSFQLVYPLLLTYAARFFTAKKSAL